MGDPLAAVFEALSGAGRRALIPYLSAGYPSPAATSELLDRFADSGADVIELGIPFSDPLADGPTIQRAFQRALEQGVTPRWVLDALAAFRSRHDTPVVLFGYLNPVLAYGLDAFVADASSAGAQGLLLTDLPVDNDPALERALEESPLALVRLVAPTTSPERAKRIAARAQGFVYYVARTGVTGATAALRAELGEEVAALRAASRVPVAVGFGISSPEQAATVAGIADGVVVGSALIDALDRQGEAGAADLLARMRAAMDKAVH